MTGLLAATLCLVAVPIAAGASPANAEASGQTHLARQAPASPDALVTYTFPDGSTQRVPSVVAVALDRAFNGRDAYGAYSGTGVRVPGSPLADPSHLRTGCVSRWSGSTLLTVFKSGSIFVIKSGRMTAFSHSVGSGAFLGFYQPSGI